MKTNKKEKTFEKWTRKELEALPRRNWDEDIGEFNSLIILPTKDIHDSGFQCMDFVAVKNNIPFIRLSGCSDVLHIGGIGGFNNKYWYKDGGKPFAKWSIDCLPKSGLLRLFSGDKLICSDALSSFGVFSGGKNAED